MVAANKLLHLLEAFSTPWFLFSSPQNHHLIFFLLEVFNNIIQYQFDGGSINVNQVNRCQTQDAIYSWICLTGNSNLVYAIIRKRSVFHQLANLPSDTASIQKALQKKRRSGISRSNSIASEALDNSRAPAASESRLFKASLEATPGMDSSVPRLA